MEEWRPFIGIDEMSSEPLFLQIKRGLSAWITKGLREGVLSPGDRVPSERDLSKQFGISGITVKRSLNELEQEGLIYRIQGRGSFIAKQRRITMGLERFYSLTTVAKEKGLSSICKLISINKIHATANIARNLEILENNLVAKLIRLRLMDNEPLAVDTSFLPLKLFPDITSCDFNAISLYELMASRYNVEPIRAREYLEPVLINDFESELLNISAGQPAMLLERVAYTVGDKPIEFTKSVIRGDRCRFSVEMLKEHL